MFSGNLFVPFVWFQFLNGDRRWILWLGETSPSVLKSLPNVLDRINKVKKYRHASKSKLTNELAQKPTRFHVENIPTYTYVVIPETSSERRYYIPIGFVGKNVVTSNSMKIVPNATLYHFGVLESMMHMAWMRAVCGRFESRYRYSKDIVYNNFPWPDNPSSEKVEKIEKAAGDILTIRAKYHDSTLADLYDPLTMPADLLKAHQKLDKAVDNCYNARMKFATEADRLEYLFEKYEELVQKHNKNI